jgi:E3 ubiquitin-protein ligase RGLG
MGNILSFGKSSAKVAAVSVSSDDDTIDGTPSPIRKSVSRNNVNEVLKKSGKVKKSKKAKRSKETSESTTTIVTSSTIDETLGQATLSRSNSSTASGISAMDVRNLPSFKRGSSNAPKDPKRAEREEYLRHLASTNEANEYKFFAIKDEYKSLEDVSEALHAAGLESSNLILAIDFTKSNNWTGRDTFGGKNLHDSTLPYDNPYMLAIRTIGTVMAPYDDDNIIPVFGFGDTTTTDKSVFPFFPDRAARGFEEALARYKELVPKVKMSGPTNFAPAIEAAIQICERQRSYHILVIIADGQVTNRAHTEAAIVRASNYPLSIILVGVGDGPWDTMEEFDDSLPQRKFDNFQFVNMTEIIAQYNELPEVAFSLACLMEVPEQYHAIRALGLI